VLLDCLSDPFARVLDLGSGDGRLLGLVKLARPEASAVALDFSPTMLERLRTRFAGEKVDVVTMT
jgi:tRNA (cmo5U34)-methyltransferase